MQINPFSSRFTNPNACQFISPVSETSHLSGTALIESLAKKFLGGGGVSHSSQIIGPHGCGKSTLAIAVGRQLPQAQARTAGSPSIIRSLTLRKSERGATVARWGKIDVYEMAPDELRLGGLPIDEMPSTSGNSCSRHRQILIVDGIELLSRINRSLLLRQMARSESKLLLTTHRRLQGVEVLANLQPHMDHFRRIVKQLLANCEHPVSIAEIENAFEVSRGDYRLALRMLYDHWQMNFAKSQDVLKATNLTNKHELSF